MRFLKDGPTIPDDLLIARDEGRVVFFCGAGVSMARAGLLDFFGLVAAVIHKLGVSPDSPASIILSEAKGIDKRTGLSGLISVDRIFGLLERDFLERDIEAAVAAALRPGDAVDLSAHQILLDLATTPEGKVRLVTTNFDRLFEASCDSPKIWKPPLLPDPSRPGEMDGIIHLHGCVTGDYTAAEGEHFILSSSEFGRAYLSEGWATQFVRDILERYVVVFVGYTADDPPILYLLESLNKKAGRLDGVYAFQAGLENEATAKWLHKGVEAIPYAESDGHWRLWETLAAWAERAKAPDEWYKSVINLAIKGPAQAQPHERGQVAHIISTLEGARRFSEGDAQPPAEWLCVFDPNRRYAKSGHTGDWDERGLFIDPFDLYGLDSDRVPKRIDPNNPHEKREVPADAWDGLAANRLDRQNLRDEHFSAIRGHWAINIPSLPSRLLAIGIWLMKVVDQPSSVWWAASQSGLHPDIIKQIQWQLEQANKDIGPEIRKAWRCLFEAWENSGRDFHHDWYNLKAAIDKDGWNSAAIRKYGIIKRPYLKVEQNYWKGPIPPAGKKDIQLRDMLLLDVEYPDTIPDAKVPDEWLARAVRELRQNLECALQLETECGGYGLNNISPIISDDAPNIDHYGRTHGLSGSVISFASLFNRLIAFDSTLARQEFESWPLDDETIFSRLRIWAYGKSELVSAQTFGSVIAALSDDAFWNGANQRDLLLALAKRWPYLNEETRKEIEIRLLEGRAKWEGEEDAEFQKSKAWRSLSRLHWLAKNGCNFTFDLERETINLRKVIPEWNPDYASKAAESVESRGGIVETKTEHSALVDEPIENILAKALELSGRSEDLLVDHDPFAGLSAERPVRAFSTLTHAAKQGEYPEWAWRTFLNTERRKKDSPRFSALIAERISRYPNHAVAEIIRPTSNWLLDTSKVLTSYYPRTLDKLMSKLIDVLRAHPQCSASAIVRGESDANWTMEAINAPAGKIAQAMFNDLRTNDLKVSQGFPAEWLAYAYALLSLSGDSRRYALVIFSYNLNYFYTIDPNWTEANILAVLDKGDEKDRMAIWSGFLWGGRVPNKKPLYMRLKPYLLTMAKQDSVTRSSYSQVLSGMILAGWGSTLEAPGERWISNAEMHDVLLHTDDKIRSQVLWQGGIWAESANNEIAQQWTANLPELLRDVWPRHKSVKTPKMSASLCDLAFSNIDRFQEIGEIVLPLLTTVESDHLTLPPVRGVQNSIVDLYPKLTLALLHAVLPDNVRAWPYGIGDILQRIGEADGTLNLDERLIELNRKWNSR